MTKATIYVGALVSKAKNASVSAAVVDGIPGEPEGVRIVLRASSPGDPSPTTALARSIALGVGTAIYKGATAVEVFCSSKAAVAQVQEWPAKSKVDDVIQAHMSAWTILWTRDRCPDGWSVQFLPAALLDDRLAPLLEAAMKANNLQGQTTLEVDKCP